MVRWVEVNWVVNGMWGVLSGVYVRVDVGWMVGCERIGRKEIRPVSFNRAKVTYGLARVISCFKCPPGGEWHGGDDALTARAL